MDIEEKELTRGQAVNLGRARTATENIFRLAREVAAQEFDTDPELLDQETVLAVAQIMATTYHATVLQTKSMT